MTVGVVVDGVSEYAALPALFDELRRATQHSFLRPVVAKIPPLAPFPVIARSCVKEVSQLHSRDAEIVVVLLDRETRDDCCPLIASEVRRLLGAQCAGGGVEVVVKDKTFENWLLADVAAVASIRGRFQVSNAARNAVEPNKADNVPALNLLKAAVTSGSYEKVADSKRILERASAPNIALNSRSFRRFLRVIGHPSYVGQSARP